MVEIQGESECEQRMSRPLSVTITMPNVDKYLEKIQAAGNNIDSACKEAVNAALPIVEKSMKEGAHRHRKTGAVEDAIEAFPAEQNGDYIYGAVGIDLDKHPEAEHAIYQEYGDGHSPEFPDPFVRPAVNENKKEILAAERAVLKLRGVPIE